MIFQLRFSWVMSNEVTNKSNDDEQTLNPAPLSYRVSYRAKCGFLVLVVFGFALYAYMVIDRRISQGRFLRHNQMAAVKLVPATLPAIMAHDVKNGEDSSLSSYVKGWTLLNIWATWCPPCKEEMPSLELLHQKMGDKLTIVGLAVDDNVTSVKEFVATHNPTFTVLWDPYQKSSLNFGVDKYPETFLISPDGLVTMQFSGPRDWASPTAIDYFSSIVK